MWWGAVGKFESLSSNFLTLPGVDIDGNNGWNDGCWCLGLETTLPLTRCAKSRMTGGLRLGESWTIKR